MLKVIIYFLYPFSFIYASVMYIRNLFFDVRLFRSKKLSAPVISVGNLTTGGAGKTPAVVSIARQLQAYGCKVGVVGRGYKRASRGYVLVSDGVNVLVDAERGGDEPVMLAHALPGAIVAVDENRCRGGEYIIENFPVDVIILDDGFQHRALHRDLDIVLINASRQDHLRAHIPVGRLRERMQSLQRADIVLITKYTNDRVYESIEHVVQRYAAAPILGLKFRPAGCVDVFRQGEMPIEKLITKTAYLFSGIAETEDFHKTVRDLHITVQGVRWFKDHHRFGEEDIRRLLKKAEASGADILLTTEKDAVRLNSYKDLFIQRIPLYALRISITMKTKDQDVLNTYMHRVMNRHKRSVTIN